MEAGLTAHLGAGWSHAVFVCGKCSKKLDGGFGPKGKTRLAKALRRFLGIKKRGKGPLGVIETRCLGVCPKDAVTVINGADSCEWLIVPVGMELTEIAAELGI